MSSEGERQFLLECGLLPNSVLYRQSQSHSRLRGSVRIFGDPQIFPQVVFEVIYPWSTSVLVEPCGSQNLACGSYIKLQRLCSSSVFPVYLAIRRFAVDNEAAETTIMTMIAGVGSAAFDGVMISKQTRAMIGARADINIWKLFGRLRSAGSHSFPNSGFLTEQLRAARATISVPPWPSCLTYWIL